MVQSRLDDVDIAAPLLPGAGARLAGPPGYLIDSVEKLAECGEGAHPRSTCARLLRLDERLVRDS